eukprot:maker-scaffold_1-snap-gene-20.67-mRNA-1 protein AED:0.01 eAED:0.01 QI:93/1/1/1/1/1/2/52/437
MDTPNDELLRTLQDVREASYGLSGSSAEERNDFLESLKRNLFRRRGDVFLANQVDKDMARKNKLDTPLQKRLDLQEAKLTSLITGIEALLSLPDPLNEITEQTELDTGLILSKVSCPIGVLCIIFESRPEAVIQITTLAIKSGNCVILKGGKEAKESNHMLVNIIQQSLDEVGFSRDCVYLVKDRSEISTLLKQEDYIDLFIPRGSNSLVKYIMQNTNIPVVGHADGICHIYVHEDADLSLATSICLDSKTQYPAVCNAVECILVDKSVKEKVLPALAKELLTKNVIMHCDSSCLAILRNHIVDKKYLKELNDPHTEYLTYAVSLKEVDGIDEAISFINKNGSHHTDCLISKNEMVQNKFMREVDSAGVFFNCSTRFADGFRYGFGAEVGVSTNKLHARGPVGMQGLLTYKYKLEGQGHIVKDYSEGTKKFTHKKLI